MKRDGIAGAGLLLGAALAALFIFTSDPAYAVVPDGSPLPPDDAPDPGVTDPSTENAMQTADPISAFLYMIRCCENSSVLDTERYFRFYGNSTFSNITDHPVITGEKVGVPLPDSFCTAAGLKPGCVSTAAGAYQINKPSWLSQGGKATYGDFGPDAQDAWCIDCLNSLGAIAALQSGDFSGALAKASRKWASLPGSTANQHPVSFGVAQGYFNDGLAAQNSTSG